MTTSLVLLSLTACMNGFCGGAQVKDVDALVEKLGNKDDGVVTDAVFELRKIGGPAVPALARALKRPEEQIREMAATSLWGIGQLPGNVHAQAAVPDLIDVIEKDPSAKVRWQAVSALARIGPTKAAIPGLIQAVEKDDSSNAAWALGMLGPDAKKAVPALMAAANKKGVEIRETGIDDKWELRCRAVEALVSIKLDAKDLTPLLRDRLSDVAPVKLIAYQGLAGLGPDAKDAIPTILKQLRGKRDPAWYGIWFDLRLSAAFALAKIDKGNAEAVSAILKLGKDKEQPLSRAVACDYLGDIGNSSEPVLAFLKEALSDEQLTVRGAAGDALEKLTKKEK